MRITIGMTLYHKLITTTRMHSSRMRTACCSGHLMAGGCLPAGVVCPGGCLPRGGGVFFCLRGYLPRGVSTHEVSA